MARTNKIFEKKQSSEGNIFTGFELKKEYSDQLDRICIEESRTKKWVLNRAIELFFAKHKAEQEQRKTFESNFYLNFQDSESEFSTGV